MDVDGASDEETEVSSSSRQLLNQWRVRPDGAWEQRADGDSNGTENHHVLDTSQNILADSINGMFNSKYLADASISFFVRRPRILPIKEREYVIICCLESTVLYYIRSIT